MLLRRPQRAWGGLRHCGQLWALARRQMSHKGTGDEFSFLVRARAPAAEKAQVLESFFTGPVAFLPTGEDKLASFHRDLHFDCHLSGILYEMKKGGGEWRGVLVGCKTRVRRAGLQRAPLGRSSPDRWRMVAVNSRLWLRWALRRMRPSCVTAVHSGNESWRGGTGELRQ